MSTSIPPKKRKIEFMRPEIGFEDFRERLISLMQMKNTQGTMHLKALH